MNLRLFTVASLLITQGMPALGQEAPTQKFGGFSLRTITDPMTDASRGILFSPDGDIQMVVKCDSNGPGTLYISFISRHYLGALRYNTRDVKYRIDSAPPETISAFYEGSTANILNLKPESAGGRFLARVKAASKLTVQVTSFNYDLYTQVIDLDGFRPGLARAAAICRDSNWYAVDASSSPRSATTQSIFPTTAAKPSPAGETSSNHRPGTPLQQLGPNIWVYTAETPSGKCIQAPADYRGTGSASRPAISSAMPRC